MTPRRRSDSKRYRRPTSVLSGSGQEEGIRRNPTALRHRWIGSPVLNCAGDGNFGGFGGFGGDGAEFNLGDLFGAAGQTGGANIGDLFGGLFGRGAQQPRPSRPRRGNDLETETELSFLEATKGVAMPKRKSMPGTVHQLSWQRCAPGYQSQGVPELQRRGRDQPQPGRVRFLRTVHRVPWQWLDHRRAVRRVQGHRRDDQGPARSTCGSRRASRTVSGSGWPARARPGLRGAPSGDLYVTVHVQAGQGVRP